MLNLLLHYIVAGESDGIEETPIFQVIVNPRAGKTSIPTEVLAHSAPLIADHDGLQHLPPTLGAGHIPRPQLCPLAISKLVEHKDRVIAHAFKVAVVGRSFLFSIYRALGAVHIQDDSPVPGVSHGPVSPLL